MKWSKARIERDTNDILSAFGPAETPEALEALAFEVWVEAEEYGGGPDFARALAAELSHRALILRNRGAGAVLASLSAA